MTFLAPQPVLMRAARIDRASPGRDQESHAMQPGEKAELQRQGAKAAARGDAAASNPMLHQLNLPGATGETPQEWGLRYGAWRAGYEQQILKPAPGGWLRIRR